jgi:hypothetical protein
MTLSGNAPPAVPDLSSLAMLAADVYNAVPAGTSGWTPSREIPTALGQIVNYTNSDGSQVVIAIEGTNPSNGRDIWTDLTAFPSGNPTVGLTA